MSGLLYADGYFPFCIPDAEIWDGNTYFEQSYIQTEDEANNGIYYNYTTKTPSNSSSEQNLVVGAGTEWLEVPLELASLFYWRVMAHQPEPTINVSIEHEEIPEHLEQPLNLSLTSDDETYPLDLSGISYFAHSGHLSLPCSYFSVQFGKHGDYHKMEEYGGMSVFRGGRYPAVAKSGNKYYARLSDLFSFSFNLFISLPWILTFHTSAVKVEGTSLDWNFINLATATLDVSVEGFGKLGSLPLQVVFSDGYYGEYDPPSFSISAEVNFKFKKYFTYGGIYDENTGQRV